MEIQIKPRTKDTTFMLECTSEKNHKCGVSLENVGYVKITGLGHIYIDGKFMTALNQNKPIIVYVDLMAFGRLYDLIILDEVDINIWVNWIEKKEE